MQHETDVAIVGAGLSGLVAACEIAEAGRKIVLLDQEPEQSLADLMTNLSSRVLDDRG